MTRVGADALQFEIIRRCADDDAEPAHAVSGA
jgi:hypothetical protein